MFRLSHFVHFQELPVLTKKLLYYTTRIEIWEIFQGGLLPLYQSNYCLRLQHINKMLVYVS